MQACSSLDVPCVTTRKTSRRKCSEWEYTSQRGNLKLSLQRFSTYLSRKNCYLLWFVFVFCPPPPPEPFVWASCRDASWELEANAYAELLEVYKRCDALTCLCNNGCTHSAKSGYGIYIFLSLVYRFVSFISKDACKNNIFCILVMYAHVCVCVCVCVCGACACLLLPPCLPACLGRGNHYAYYAYRHHEGKTLPHLCVCWWGQLIWPIVVKQP